MLFDDQYYYSSIDEAEFDSMALFVQNHGYDKCKRKIITFYQSNDEIKKQIKTQDNFLKQEIFHNKDIVTKYYIETFDLFGFEITNRTYVRIFGFGSYFRYLKTEEMSRYEHKTNEKIIKEKFRNYDQHYLQFDEKAFLKGETVWKK